MKIVSLTIVPEKPWELPSKANPLTATVKMRDTNKTDLSVKIPAEMMGPLTELLSPLIVAAATQQINEFVKLTEAGQVLELAAN